MFSCLQILYIVITHMRRQFKLLNIPSRCKYQTLFYHYSIKIFKFSSDLENTTIICMSLLKDIFQLWDLVFFANEILNIPKEVTLKLYTAYLQQKWFWPQRLCIMWKIISICSTFTYDVSKYFVSKVGLLTYVLVNYFGVW